MAYGIVEGTEDVAFLLREGYRLLQRGGSKTVLDICSRFPPLYKASTPSIGLLETFALELSGQPERAQSRYEAMLKHTTDPSVRDLAALWTGRFGKRRAFLKTSPVAGAVQGIQKLHGGHDVETGVCQLRDGWLASQDDTDPQRLFDAAHAHAMVGCIFSGRFHETDTVSARVRPVLKQAGFLYSHAHLCLDQAVAAVVSSNVVLAKRRLQEAAQHLDLFPQSFVGHGIRAARCYLAVEKRDRRALKEERNDWADWKALPSQMHPLYLRTLILGAILMGEPASARRQACQLRRLVEGEQGLYIPECHLALACLEDARGETESALSCAVAAYRMAVDLHMAFWVMKSSSVLAHLLRHRRRDGADVQSRQFLVQAIRLALEHDWPDYWRTDPLACLRPLFKRFDTTVPPGAAITPARMSRLADKLARTAEMPAAILPPPELDDQVVRLHCLRQPLGERPLQVLGWGVFDLTTEAIADRLDVRFEEVESAQAALCRRLRVPNFSSAVQKGLGLGLVVADAAASTLAQLAFRGPPLSDVPACWATRPGLCNDATSLYAEESAPQGMPHPAESSECVTSWKRTASVWYETTTFRPTSTTANSSSACSRTRTPARSCGAAAVCARCAGPTRGEAKESGRSSHHLPALPEGPGTLPGVRLRQERSR